MTIDVVERVGPNSVDKMKIADEEAEDVVESLHHDGKQTPKIRTPVHETSVTITWNLHLPRGSS